MSIEETRVQTIAKMNTNRMPANNDDTARSENQSSPAIEVQNLTVSYGPTPALLDVSVTIPAGQLVGVIGPNGSGKSTLMKSILGFVKPDFGTVKLFGEPAERAVGRVAYVPQRGTVDWDFRSRSVRSR